jgi:hypothetical protein
MMWNPLAKFEAECPLYHLEQLAQGGLLVCGIETGELL